ncbi:MAG: PLDc N-terminal domain-containing protein [Syntrophorhabdus sp.]
MLINILTLPFWIAAIVSILRGNFQGNDKVVWLLVVILLYTLGVILYFFIGRKKKLRNAG